MANEKPKKAAVVEPELLDLGETKVKFLVWFSGAWSQYVGCQPHHLQAIAAFFADISIADPNTPAAFEEGMQKFGFGRK
jgi:hypothetical protein